MPFPKQVQYQSTSKKNLSQKVCFRNKAKNNLTLREPSQWILHDLLFILVWHIHVFPHGEQKKVSHGSGDSTQRHTELLPGIRRDCNTSQCSFHLSSTAECELPGRTNTLCTVSDPELLGYWHIINQGWEQTAHTYRGEGGWEEGRERNLECLAQGQRTKNFRARR